jgi:hypothetical protein
MIRRGVARRLGMTMLFVFLENPWCGMVAILILGVPLSPWHGLRLAGMTEGNNIGAAHRVAVSDKI